MTDLTEYQLHQLIDYFEGRGTDAGRAAVEAWIAADEARSRAVERLRLAWAVAGETQTPAWASEAMWPVVIDGRRTPPSTNETLSAPELAAIRRATTEPNAVGLRTALASTGESVALSGPRRELLRMRGWRSTTVPGWRWTATLSLAATLCIAIVAWLAFGRVTHIQTTQREYVTGPDERATIRLGDGSQIVLGPNTRVRYAAPFGARDRNVSLTGKAYFTVASRASTPFVVYTAYSATQVLGTAFVVKAMPSDSVVQVVVESGKVALRQRTSQPGTGTTLVHGELGRLSASGLMTVSHDVDAAVYTSWSQDRVTFSATPASTVVHALEERYDLHFVLPPHFDPSTPVSFAIDVETGDQAAQILATMLHLTFTRTGRVVTLRPM